MTRVWFCGTLVCLLSLSLLVSPTAAQQTTRSEDAKRWEPAIQAFEKQDAEKAPPENATLFVGSSSIRMWDVQKWFPSQAVINRGFGGSQYSDAIEFVDRIVTPYRPRAIVVYEGDNDLARGKNPDQVVADCRQFIGRIRRQLPTTPIIILAIKPSTKRWALAPQIQETNRRIAELCRRDSTLHFVDVFTPMLNDQQQPRPELLISDGLHMNDKGYEIWTRLVGVQLQRLASDN